MPKPTNYKTHPQKKDIINTFFPANFIAVLALFKAKSRKLQTPVSLTNKIHTNSNLCGERQELSTHFHSIPSL